MSTSELCRLAPAIFTARKAWCCNGIANRPENGGIDYRSGFNDDGTMNIRGNRRVHHFDTAVGMEDYSTFRVHSDRCAWRPSQIQETMAMDPSSYHELYKTETCYNALKLRCD